MFTGIIRHVGSIVHVRASSGGRRLTIDVGPLAEDLAAGDSVAVSGACLTVVGLARMAADFDVIGETLARSTLGQRKPGDPVNLERPVSAGGLLDGHIVQGHVDGVAEVRSVRRGAERVVELAAETQLTDLMVPKGSVAVDGVSLTLVDVAERRFSVALIPATLAETTLGGLGAGALVNVETDVIGKYVLRYLRQMTPAGAAGVTLDKLKKAGFV